MYVFHKFKVRPVRCSTGRGRGGRGDGGAGPKKPHHASWWLVGWQQYHRAPPRLEWPRFGGLWMNAWWGVRTPVTGVVCRGYCRYVRTERAGKAK